MAKDSQRHHADRPAVGHRSARWALPGRRQQFNNKVVVRGGSGIYYDRGELFTYFSPGYAAGASRMAGPSA